MSLDEILEFIIDDLIWYINAFLELLLGDSGCF